MSEKYNNLPDLIKSKTEESEAYFRQWLVWLGVGSAGGAFALSSLAAHLPNPNYGFKFVLPSLWVFLLGIVLAGLSVLVLSRKLSTMAEHFSHAHNRDEIKRAINQIPEVFSAPQSIADKKNSERNAFIEKHNVFHNLAEKSWKRQLLWSKVLVICSSFSAILFVLGIAMPLIQISLGKSLQP